MSANGNEGKERGSILDGLPPHCGVVLAPIIASIMAEGLDSDQIVTLGAFVNIIGDSLGYIAAQAALNEDLGTASDETAIPVI